VIEAAPGPIVHDFSRKDPKKSQHQERMHIPRTFLASRESDRDLEGRRVVASQTNRPFGFLNQGKVQDSG
jgi:hypothetical protein